MMLLNITYNERFYRLKRTILPI